MARLDSVVERSDEISFNIDIYGVTVDSVVKFIRTKPILYTRMTRVEDMRSVWGIAALQYFNFCFKLPHAVYQLLKAQFDALQMTDSS